MADPVRTQTLGALIPWRPLLLAAATTLAALAKLIIAIRTVGTNDVTYYTSFADSIARIGALRTYYGVDIFNHPPFVVHLLRLWAWAASLTGLPIGFWIRCFSTMADAGNIWVLYRMLTRRQVGDISTVSLWLLALSPVTFLVSGFHGNTDSLFIFFVLLAVYLLQLDEPFLVLSLPGKRSVPLRASALSGLAFGLSADIKIVPIIAVACFYFFIRAHRDRIAFLLSAAGAWIVLGLPHILRDPIFIMRRVFGYGSITGHWGFSRLLDTHLPDNAATVLYDDYGKYLLIVVIVVASWLLNRPAARPPLLWQVGFVFFIFLAFAPGFGVQYLVWLAPWAAALGLEAGLLFSATAGSFLFLVYNFWSTTFPWNYADSDAVGDWSGYIVHYELMTWIVVLVIAVVIYPAFLWTRWYRPAPASAGIERWRAAGRITTVLIASLILVMACVDLKGH